MVRVICTGAISTYVQIPTTQLKQTPVADLHTPAQTQQHANLHSFTRFANGPGLSVPCIVTICMSARM